MNNSIENTSSIDARRKYDFIYILKFVAILLITNSHFKPVYPEFLSKFAFGGAMGCAIFFFVSGFTLALSRKGSFLQFYGKRILRIYPAFWLYYLVTFDFESPISFIWPHLWFIQAIMTFYALFYFVSKYASPYYLSIAVALSILFICIYFAIEHSIWMIDYAQHPYKIHWIYYFVFMLIGAWCRVNMEKIKIPINYDLRRKILPIGICFVSFVVTYGLKYVCEQNIISINFQLLFPLMLFISIFAFLYASMVFKLSESFLSKSVIWIGNRTLELFIVQVIIIREYVIIDNTIVRFFAVVLSILLCAGILHWIVNLLVSPVLKKI